MRLAFLLAVFALLASGARAGDIGPDCTLGGVRLQGKVKIVDSFPDLKVQIVESFPDLNVLPVTSFPDSCGKWQIVDSFPDFTVQFVDSFPDLTIALVGSFPGVPSIRHRSPDH
jgi:hypothetical protein